MLTKISTKYQSHDGGTLWYKRILVCVRWTIGTNRENAFVARAVCAINSLSSVVGNLENCRKSINFAIFPLFFSHEKSYIKYIPRNQTRKNLLNMTKHIFCVSCPFALRSNLVFMMIWHRYERVLSQQAKNNINKECFHLLKIVHYIFLS